MRKKNHKRIDPKDKSYDKFYLINYLVSPFLLLFHNQLVLCQSVSYINSYSKIVL